MLLQHVPCALALHVLDAAALLPSAAAPRQGVILGSGCGLMAADPLRLLAAWWGGHRSCEEGFSAQVQLNNTLTDGEGLVRP